MKLKSTHTQPNSRWQNPPPHVHIMIHILCICSIVLFSNCINLLADDTDYAFEYREIYLPEMDTHLAKELKLNDLDTDWGLWGHNLGTILPANPSQTVYATIGGNLSHDQFCFSSVRLYDYIEKYIEDNFRNSHPMRFAILPNDNFLVCMCPECRALGNTDTNASPAVLHLIGRLAERFPKHQFFTSYYHTTRSVPDRQLPANVGILISAMTHPLSPVETPQEAEFMEVVRQCKAKCDLVYIWDYINNFDDYFTPFPVFTIMQRRLGMYAQAGVNGIFLNGSGNDYSTFSDIKIRVLAALMQAPTIDWRTTLKVLCQEHYPITGDAIAQFIIAQEDYVTAQGRLLPIYAGVDAELKTYLPADAFIAFYDKLQEQRPKILANERKQVDRMCSAMAMTRLELMRLNTDVAQAPALLDQLNTLPDADIDVYSESCWTVSSYVFDYEFMLRHASSVEGSNLLRGVTIKALTPLDEDYADPAVLTDGLLGLPANYHQGQMLSSANPSLRLSVPIQPGMRRLCLWFTRNPLYHISLPLKVSVDIAGSATQTVVPHSLSTHQGHSLVEFNIPPSAHGNATVTIVRNLDDRTMALEEIEGLKD